MHQDCQEWQKVPPLNVRDSCQAARITFPHQTEQRIQIRFMLVGYISGELEWFKPASVHNYAASYSPRVLNPNRCVRFLGLWGIF